VKGDNVFAMSFLLILPILAVLIVLAVVAYKFIQPRWLAGLVAALVIAVPVTLAAVGVVVYLAGR
jgi:cation transporter-like permease